MKLFEIINPINLALWISPKGDVIKVNGNHIDDIINHPSKFGLTSAFVSELYNKYGERLGQEGKAREELIKLALRTGWVRVRNYRNYWSVTIDRLSPRIIANISKWVDNFINSDIMGKYADLKIYEVSSDRMRTVDAIKVVTDNILEN